MRFTDKQEAAAAFARLGFDASGKLVAGSHGAAHLRAEGFYYDSGRLRSGLAGDLSCAMIDELGEFSSCLLWACDLVWGDRSREAAPPDEWLAFRRWREEHGESRGLYDAPGHAFGPGERATAGFVIEKALLLGWDALIMTKAGKPILRLSHDDDITIFSRSRPGRLIHRLEKLGLKPFTPRQ